MIEKILEASKLNLALSNLRNSNPGIRVVLCHGVFDLVHPGHLEHFDAAKKLGDILVVSITADKFVKKGPNRPYFNELYRAKFLAALEQVNYVFIVNSESGIDSIGIIKPNFYVKGPDYREMQSDITGKIELEKKEVEKFGGELVFTNGFTASSTRLINDALIPEDSEVKLWAKDFKKKYSTSFVSEWIDKLSKLDVGILGEIIIDEYTTCTPLSKSSKDPILAFQRYNTSRFAGGVLAIADSCSKWAKNTEVFSACGNDLHPLLSVISPSSSYNQKFLRLKDRSSIIKHRFVDQLSGNRVFEYYDFNPEAVGEEIEKGLVELLGARIQKNSLLLVADYGHGLLGDHLITYLCNSKAYLAVNTQSNAGNRGFNNFSKYPRIDFLCINGSELELELRKKDLDYFEVVPQIMRQKQCSYAVVTLGSRGLLTFDSLGVGTRTPAFATRVVDKVGAGDSVLAMASMLAFLDAPPEIIGLLSSVVAAFEVSQLGHNESMSLIDIKRFVNGVLG